MRNKHRQWQVFYDRGLKKLTVDSGYIPTAYPGHHVVYNIAILELAE